MLGVASDVCLRVCRNPPKNIEKVLANYGEGVFCFIHSCHISKYGLTILDRLLDKLKEYGNLETYKKIFIINVPKI